MPTTWADAGGNVPSVTLTLGDAFNRRKKLAADLQNWINRLGLAGTERRSYRTAALDGGAAYQPDPGTEKVSTRQYTVEECRVRHLSKVLSKR
jgi:hypothetical protein